MAKLQTERRLAIERHDRALQETIALEIALGIDPSDRWTPEHPRYQAAVKFLNEKRYRTALDDLQGLMVKRISGLRRLHLGNTSK